MESSSHENFGTAFFNLEELRNVSALWDGPLHPTMLESIETSLRGLITAKKLTTLRQANDLYGSSDSMDWRQPFFNEYFTPFQDHVLDYEFIDPESTFVNNPLGRNESDHLSDYVASEIFKEVVGDLSKFQLNRWQADRYVEMWYKGGTPEQCIYHTLNYDPVDYKNNLEILAEVGDDYPEQPFDAEHGPFQLSSFQHLMGHAKYFVSTHRSGYQIFSSGPLSRVCEQHVFSVWPNKIFEDAALNYKELSRELRGPGLGIDLPMVISIVLSRAETRESIPRAIVDLREEYERARNQLWVLLTQMWTESSFSQQNEILREIQAASQSIFPAAFPERFDTMSLALDLSKLSVGGIASGLKELRRKDLPNVRVSAITFAKELSNELKNNLLNTRELLSRHLTNAERRDFGML